MLKALGLPQGWRKKLLRSFGDANSMEQVLAELTGAQRRDPLPETLAVLVAEGDETGLARMLEAEMLEAGISPSSGRSPAEIARRLIEKEDLAATRFPASALDLLKQFLEMRVSLDSAAVTLRAFASEHALDLAAVLQKFEARSEAVANAGIATKDILYDASFGRPLDYYTGLVYEIRAAGVEKDAVLAGGGRYDRLLTMLGASENIPGVGFSIWLDRLQALAERKMSVTLALPSKGRLKEQTLAVLEKAGYKVVLPDDSRNYRARVEGEPDLDILFLSASEIARELGYGSVDLGVTGEDLVRETLAHSEERVAIEAELGFGHADVIVAVPEVWRDVTSMADLDDVAADFRQRHGRRLRIATKYWRLTQQFFAKAWHSGLPHR